MKEQLLRGPAIFTAERDEQTRGCRKAWNGFEIFYRPRACMEESACKWHSQAQHPRGWRCGHPPTRTDRRTLKSTSGTACELEWCDPLAPPVLSLPWIASAPFPQDRLLKILPINKYGHLSVLGSSGFRPLGTFITLHCVLLILFLKSLTLSPIKCGLLRNAWGVEYGLKYLWFWNGLKIGNRNNVYRWF